MILVLLPMASVRAAILAQIANVASEMIIFYSFRHGCRQLNVLVYDADTKQPLENVDVRLVKNGVNKELFVTASDGKVSVCLETGTDFEFKAMKEGYEANGIGYGTFATSLKKQDFDYDVFAKIESTTCKGNDCFGIESTTNKWGSCYAS